MLRYSRSGRCFLAQAKMTSASRLLPCGAVAPRRTRKAEVGSGGGLVDVFDAKRDAMTLLSALGVNANAVHVVPGGPSFLHPGRSATLQFGPKTAVGWFGQLHPSACEALDAEGPIVAFEITLDAVPGPKARPIKTKPQLNRSDFMPVERDLAFVRRRDGQRRRYCQGGGERRNARLSPESACSTCIAEKA